MIALVALVKTKVLLMKLNPVFLNRVSELDSENLESSVPLIPFFKKSNT